MTDPIKVKIQELCPDVMELKFGCEVAGFLPAYEESFEGPSYPAKRAMGIVTNSPYLQIDEVFGDVLIDDLKKGIVSEEDDVEFEILGSPITLAVVLRALFKETVPEERATPILDLVERWNLSLDNYDQQSEECKQFIGSLLTNEK